MAPVQLHLFRDIADLDAFAGATVSAFHACLGIAEDGGLKLASVGQAIMLSRLVIRMLEYKAGRAAELTPNFGESIALIDREIDSVWPSFKEVVDDEIEDAQERWRKAAETAN
jgi:hypothetical protein